MKNALRFILFVVALGYSSLACAARPNVLYLMVDDLNDYISLLEAYPGIKTPNLDRLAESAMVFTHAYSDGVACQPSRESMLSGIAPNLTGCYENGHLPKFPQATTKIHKHFQENGYITMGTGKINHAGRVDEGWDRYDGWMTQGPRPKKPGIPEKIRLNPLFDYQPWDGPDTDHPDVVNRNIACEWLQEDFEKPFFMAVGLYKPHNPWTAPRRFFDRYPLDALPLPTVPEGDMDDLPPAALEMAARLGGGDKRELIKAFMASEHWKKTLQAYLACISFMDESLGMVLDALESSGHADDTIVFLAADHGFHMGEKNHFAKYGLWEKTTHILYAWRVPGVTPEHGSRCDRTVSLADVYPTMLDLCQLPDPPQAAIFKGQSIRKLLEDPKASWDRPVYSTYGYNNHSVRGQRWRYTRYANGDEELYDHTADPNEWSNLAANPEYADIKSRLARYIPKTNAPANPRKKANK